MKQVCIILLTLSTILFSGCTQRQKEEIELFNLETERTILEYEETVAQFDGKEADFIRGLALGTVDDLFLADGFSYSEVTELLQKNANELISEEPLIQSSNFYTALGVNSVTQIMIFDYRGTSYIAEILWSNLKIQMLNLEVR